MKNKKNISRRGFLKGSALSVASASILSVTSCSKKTTPAPVADPMPMRTLGKTGLKVSALAFGGGSQFLKNPDGQWEPMLERAIQLGINLFDTSSGYQWAASTTSEERFGKILPKYRDKIILSTKFEKRDVTECLKEIETSLKRLNTDYLDFLMIHSIEPSEDISAIETGIYKEIVKLKEQGVAKFIGFSSMNSSAKSRELIEKLDLDVCILAMNPTKYGDFAETALPSANEKNMGVLAMKVMRDIVGENATASELLSYVLSQPNVATALVAHHGMDKLEENVKLVKEIAAGKHTVNLLELESRLAHLASPKHLCWARPDYYDGKMC